MPFARDGSAEHAGSLRDLTLMPFWLDDPRRPAPAPALTGEASADLVVVGGGFTGLWTALRAVERDPGRDVVLVEGATVAHGATGRNGGFCAASITHGFGNGLTRWPDELATLVRLGHENLDAIEESVGRYGIDCDFVRSGSLDVAFEEHQVNDLREEAEVGARYGIDAEFLDREQVRALVDSPLYLAGVLDRHGTAIVNPARLAWGLRQACLDAGVRIHEQSPVTAINDDGSALVLRTPLGRVRARRVALATAAFPPLLRRLTSYVVPVYDYVLMSEPLSDKQRDAVGWRDRQGIGDAGNQFHYYRLTDDGRILWGGYDAEYHWNNGFGPHLDNDHDSYLRLATHFFETFPQLRGLRFTHAWGGAIDTCSRFSAFWGRAHGGRLGYVTGFTGLGVGASRFGADVLLDLIDGLDTERTRLEMVRTKPLPFPPEPLRSVGISLTRRSLDRADRGGGRRNLWLRGLDRVGLGFDS